MAERLGTGLQNLLQQFESAWYLFKRRSGSMSRSFCFIILHHPFIVRFMEDKESNGFPEDNKRTESLVSGDLKKDPSTNDQTAEHLVLRCERRVV